MRHVRRCRDLLYICVEFLASGRRRTGKTLKSPVEKLLPLLFSLILILGLGAIFSIWTATSWLEYPRFLVAAILLFVLPGYTVARWLRLDMSPIERFTLSLVLGMVNTC